MTRDFERHQARARSLTEWAWSWWWAGLMCLVIAAALFAINMPARAVAMALLYWPIAAARNICFARAEAHILGMHRACRDQPHGGQT